MPAHFFETELARIQDRFNKTFGEMAVCNIRTRQQTILAIIRLRLLKRKINTASKDSVRAEIRKFVRTKNNLNSIFNSIEKHQKERRQG